MGIYTPGDDTGSGWTVSRIVGAFLAFLGAGVIFWTVIEIFLLSRWRRSGRLKARS